MENTEETFVEHWNEGISSKSYGIQNRKHSRLYNPSVLGLLGLPPHHRFITCSSLPCSEKGAWGGWPPRAAWPTLPYPVAFHWEWPKESTAGENGWEGDIWEFIPYHPYLARAMLPLYGHNFCWTVSLPLFQSLRSLDTTHFLGFRPTLIHHPSLSPFTLPTPLKIAPFKTLQLNPLSVPFIFSRHPDWYIIFMF